MFEGKSRDFKTLVLLRIMKMLIKNTESYGIYKLENILSHNEYINPIHVLKKEREHILTVKKKQIKKDVKNKFSMIASPKIKEDAFFIAPTKDIKLKTLTQKKPRMRRSSFMRVPPRQKIDSRDLLPAHLRYLTPIPAIKNIGMDLGKLNPYLEDSNIDSIEVEGENEKIYVVGAMGKKPASIVLNHEEIEAIIDKFSLEAKIPKVEGLFKVSINNLILTAMISNVISSRFIIKKIRV